jgi:threonine dehydrogenase-like Zn-dependent dehydrogenase
VDVDMFVDAQITLEEAPEAFRALATRERSSVKTIIRP